MLDVLDFIADRGGDPQKVRDSQRRRYADEAIVDEIIGLYEEARASMHISSPRNTNADGHPSKVRSIPSQNSDQRGTERDRSIEEGLFTILRYVQYCKPSLTSRPGQTRRSRTIGAKSRTREGGKADRRGRLGKGEKTRSEDQNHWKLCSRICSN
jgi:hypothetical protein